jgi:hypothetical protein
MPQNFLACDREQEVLLPPSLREWLPEGHVAWFVIDAVAECHLGRRDLPTRNANSQRAERARERELPNKSRSPTAASSPTGGPRDRDRRPP